MGYKVDDSGTKVVEIIDPIIQGSDNRKDPQDSTVTQAEIKVQGQYSRRNRELMPKPAINKGKLQQRENRNDTARIGKDDIPKYSWNDLEATIAYEDTHPKSGSVYEQWVLAFSCCHHALLLITTTYYLTVLQSRGLGPAWIN